MIGIHGWMGFISMEECVLRGGSDLVGVPAASRLVIAGFRG